jgi:hypothetical protein
MLFEMLAGHPPYQAGDPFTVALMHVTHPVPELPEEHQWLQPLIAGLMAKQAAERFNTGAATVDAIQKLVATAPEAAKMQEASTRKGSTQRLSGSAATQQRTRVSLSKQEEKKSWLLPAAGAGVLLLAVGGWMLWPKKAADTQPTTGPVATQPSASFEQPAQPADQGGAPLSAGFTGGVAPMAPEEIQTALDVADKYLARGTTDADAGRQLLDPEDDSANYWYQRVLAAQPDNERAKKGIHALLVYYRANAHAACSKGQWVGCGVIARAGLRIDQGDPTLLALDVAAGQGERGEQAKIPPLPAD